MQGYLRHAIVGGVPTKLRGSKQGLYQGIFEKMRQIDLFPNCHRFRALERYSGR